MRPTVKHGIGWDAAGECSWKHSAPRSRMDATPVEIIVDVPAGVTIGEYERIDNGHSFHVAWDFPDVGVCETCKRQAPLNLVEKAKFLVIRDLEIWGQPSFFVYQDVQHRCPCGHRQAATAGSARRLPTAPPTDPYAPN